MPDLSHNDINQLAEFLATPMGDHLYVLFKSFEYYANKVHANEQFVLFEEIEAIRKDCKKLISEKDTL